MFDNNSSCTRKARHFGSVRTRLQCGRDQETSQDDEGSSEGSVGGGSERWPGSRVPAPRLERCTSIERGSKAFNAREN